MYRELILFADYFQFELRDKDSRSDLSVEWNDSTVRDLLVTARDAIGVGTVRDSYVRVELCVESVMPSNDDINLWDQIVDCDIEIKSGRLMIIDGESYLPTAIRIEVEPGQYSARIYYGDLASVKTGERTGDDHYKVVLWPNTFASGIVFLKRWKLVYEN